MFGKLKDKLKGALSIFSKKTEEEAETIPEIGQKIASESGPQDGSETGDESLLAAKETKIDSGIENGTEDVESISESIDKVISPDLVVKKKQVESYKSESKNVIVEKLDRIDISKKAVPDLVETEKVDKKVEAKVVESDEEIKRVVEPKTAEDLIEETKEKFKSVKPEKEKIPTPEEIVFAVKKREAKVKPVKTADDIIQDQLLEEKKVEQKKQEINEKLQNKEVKDEEVKDEPKKKGFFGKLFGKKVDELPAEIVASEKQQPADERKEEPKLEKSFLGKVRESISTRKINSEKFEKLFWDLELILLENNVSVEVIEKIKSDLAEELVDKPLPRDVSKKIEETLLRTLKVILGHEKVDLLQQAKNKKPYIIAFFGINGAGKTTSIAKLTHYFKENGLSVVLAAGDTFRAAAIQQLEEHANKLEVKMIKHEYGSDAAAVAFDAVKYAEKNKIDVVLIDTAGRLHSNTNLMAELEKIIRVTKPDFKIFVGESITGNDCIEQARKFNELVEMDGAILTKADVDEKGGAPLSISYVIGKPILFLGVGQDYKDLEEFDANLMIERLGF